jgi:1,2-diacylglycerol 3-beta-glucosyltransferase
MRKKGEKNNEEVLKLPLNLLVNKDSHVKATRQKAITVLVSIWVIISLLHWLQIQWLALGLTFILGFQSIRMLIAKPIILFPVVSEEFIHAKAAIAKRGTECHRRKEEDILNHSGANGFDITQEIREKEEFIHAKAQRRKEEDILNHSGANGFDITQEIREKGDLPSVSILAPAKNESVVLPDLVKSLCNLDYPSPLDIWIIDDGSTDETPQILKELQEKFPQLQIHRRQSKGGKSGALNSVLPFTKGEVILVCDADAQIPKNFLLQTIPLLENPENQHKNYPIGAIQVRKSITNAKFNFLTQCQQMEMSCDCFLQTHRIAIGGMTELRGNGMLVKRSLLEKCHGWNEETLTDDLDLTFKLYLLGAEIAFITTPTIQEEGVTSWKNLWRQRCRWAEGGYQRYLDYFPEIFALTWKKEIDLLLFFILQFLLPIALIPDLLWTIFYSHQPVLFTLQTLLSIILTIAFIGGLYQFQQLRGIGLIWATIQGSIYMIHWIPVMIFTTYKLCVQTQQFNWVKTEHRGLMDKG